MLTRRVVDCSLPFLSQDCLRYVPGGARNSPTSPAPLPALLRGRFGEIRPSLSLPPRPSLGWKALEGSKIGLGRFSQDWPSCCGLTSLSLSLSVFDIVLLDQQLRIQNREAWNAQFAQGSRTLEKVSIRSYLSVRQHG